MEGIDIPEIVHELTYFRNALKKYDTGWINRSDWTNVHLGSSITKDVDSNVNHGFGVDLSKLIVKVLFSTDGTDANSFESVLYTDSGSGAYGYSILAVDNNNLVVQTGSSGIPFLIDAGTGVVLTNQNWYYKIVVLKMDL